MHALVSTFVAVVALLNHAPAHSTLTLDVGSDGAFQIEHDGNPWLEGGEVAVGNCSKSEGTLVSASGQVITKGIDQMGEYDAVTLKWAKKEDPRRVVLHTSFRTYPHDDGFVVFEQYFPSTLTLDDLGVTNASAITSFPSFQRKGVMVGRDLDCFAYHGVFPALEKCRMSTYKETHQGGAPLVIYDSHDPTLPSVVFSPLNFPKAHHMTSTEQFVGAGVKATVTEIPKGHSQLFLLSGGTGINKGMMEWGDRVLNFTGKTRANLYHDSTHSTIGFWTDNGGYYHYSTGTDKSKTYMDVLPEVRAYHEKIGIPFGHWQFDSWFYPKDGGVNPVGGGGAVTNWTNMPSVFPDNRSINGMVDIQSKLKMPMVMHNRQWSSRSDYIKNLPFEWYISKKAAVPKDPLAFFSWFFRQQEGWGLTMYEQDWMCTEYDEVEALQTNLTLGDMWLEGMATGVERSNRTQQYCMPYPNDVLSAAAYQSVTNARATGDYFHTNRFTVHDNWAIGSTSLFYWAIGILPFKDGFYSSTNKQVGGQTVGPEQNPDRECLMATLSGAMVGPMDGIGLLNKTRLMTSCRSDGYVLKPDKPVSTSDACFLGEDATPETCYIYTTYSDAHSAGRIHYVYNNANESMSDNVIDSGGERFVTYNWYTKDIAPLEKQNYFAPGYENHVYVIVAPIIADSWAFVGDPTKYVTAATLRFRSVEISAAYLTAEVMGMKDERVNVCAVKTGNMKLVCKSIVFASAGLETVTLP
eukprot:Stramenopile-MAST_4_protein_1065